MGSVRFKLEEFQGRTTAKKFFHKKGIVRSAHFDSVSWLGYKQAITKYPKRFRTLITKQVSGWCSCNSKLSILEENIINKFLQCGCNDETSKHLTRCTDPGCILQLHNLIKAIMDVLNKTNVTLELADKIETYLLNQGRQTMEDCINCTLNTYASLPTSTILDGTVLWKVDSHTHSSL